MTQEKRLHIYMLEEGDDLLIEQGETWMFRADPSWLSADGELVADFYAKKSHLVGPGIAFHVPVPNRRLAKKILQIVLRPFPVDGYGVHLTRYVWQCPPIAYNLRAGFTRNVSGWSSFPPHAFERGPHATPPGFEEAFYILARQDDTCHVDAPLPQPGALIMTTDWDKDGQYRDTNKFTVLRSGQIHYIRTPVHAVTALPGSQVGYLWAYTCKGELPEKKIDPYHGLYLEDE